MVPLGRYNNDLTVVRSGGSRGAYMLHFIWVEAHFINADQIEIVFPPPIPLGVLTFGFYSDLPE